MTEFWAALAGAIVGGTLAILGSVVGNQLQAVRTQRVEIFHSLGLLIERTAFHQEFLLNNETSAEFGTYPEDLLRLVRAARAISVRDHTRLRPAVDCAHELIERDPYRSDDPTRALDRSSLSLERVAEANEDQSLVLIEVREVLEHYSDSVAGRLGRRLP